VNTPATTTTQPFRRRALKKLIIGLVATLLIAGLFLAVSFAGYMPGNPFMLVPAGIPFVYFCIGTIELLTCRPFQQLADAWMGLQGWQRGIIGTLIVVVAAFVMIVVMTALVVWFT
jgi:hypothetical protein